MNDYPYVTIPVVVVKEAPNPEYSAEDKVAAAEAGLPYDVAETTHVSSTFDMDLEVGQIIGHNTVTEVQTGTNIQTTVYTENPKMPQLFTSLSMSELRQHIKIARRG